MAIINPQINATAIKALDTTEEKKVCSFRKVEIEKNIFS